MKIWSFALLMMFSGLGFGQDLQGRSIGHIQADVSSHWFLAAWNVNNLRAESSDNSNLLLGAGYRHKSWWTEGLLWKQWNDQGGLWASDGRFRLQKKGISVYSESAAIFPSPGFYNFEVLEQRVKKRFSLRQEIEGTYRLTKQTYAAGGGGSYNLGRYRGYEFSLATVYRASPTGKDELRFYLSLNKRFALTDRK